MKNIIPNIFQSTFSSINKKGGVAFMPFLVAGDPNYNRSIEVFKTLAPYADMFEIGFPYSDPLADGPTIQAADERALGSGIDTEKVFNIIAEVRTFYKKPITVLVYANLVYQYGIEAFYKKCAEVGINGVLVPDVPFEEAEVFVKAAKKHKVSPIFMITQTTTDARLKKILTYAEGYLYLVSVLGVTGSRDALGKETFEFIKRIRKHTSLPLALGFGISRKEQIEKAAGAGINGVIVGSAIIKVLEANQKSPEKKVEEFVKELV
jgi:tryptophan synthase alpha chain